jgi:hypothetical protein
VLAQQNLALRPTPRARALVVAAKSRSVRRTRVNRDGPPVSRLHLAASATTGRVDPQVRTARPS